MSDDVLFDALHTLTQGNPSFDQILWDPDRHVISFRRVGQNEYVNLWLHRGDYLEHRVERNGGPGGIPQVLWADGEWEHEGMPRGKFMFCLPPDVAASVGDAYVTSDRLPLRRAREASGS